VCAPGVVCAAQRGSKTGRLLDAFWTDNSANSPLEKWFNSWVIWASTRQHFVVIPAVSPYDTFVSVIARNEFRAMLQRRVDFDKLPGPTDGTQPLLAIGAVDVLSGEFKAFNSRTDRITADMILASAAIPTLFRAVRVQDRTYWDGLFSQNPPVKELVDARPDEIWVIQINPKTRSGEPKNVVDIADRRNELSGNLSLHHELHFIEKIDQLLDKGLLAPNGRYKQIVVRLIELSRSLGTASKLNRDPSFIRDLMAHGAEQAGKFLTALEFENAWQQKDVDAMMRHFADGAELVSSTPFPSTWGTSRGPESIRAFVEEHLTRDLVIDLTRKQVSEDLVAWTVRTQPNAGEEAVRGVARAKFSDGKITALHLTG
jgi:NTE family protein